MQDNELVTIGVLSYNNASYIQLTLDSIRYQSYKNIELIIVDDFSSDNSVGIITKWVAANEYATKVILHTKNEGVTKTCNEILYASSINAKYITLIGSDDIMKSDRILKQQLLLNKSEPFVACVFSDMEVINEQNVIIANSFFEYIGETNNSIANKLSLPTLKQIECCIQKNFFPAPSMIYKTAIIKEVGGWDEDLYFEDWDMVLKLIYKGYKFIMTEDRLVQYRKSQTSIMANPNQSYIESMLKLCYKYSFINKEIDVAITDNFKGHVIRLYKLNNKNTSKWFFKTFKLDPTFYNFYYAIVSFLKVSYKWNIKILNSIKSIRSIFFKPFK